MTSVRRNCAGGRGGRAMAGLPLVCSRSPTRWKGWTVRARRGWPAWTGRPGVAQRSSEGDKLPFIHLTELDIVKVGMSGGSNAGAVVTARNAAFAEDAMKSWGVLPSDNTVWWVLLWIVMTAFFVGVAWFIMEVIDYYVVLPARTAFAIWVGLSWLLVWQVGARIAAHERRRFGLKTR